MVALDTKVLDGIKDYFWDNVEKGDACWIWSGPKMPNGYGRIHRLRHDILAHRYSYMLHHGTIPKGLDVDHQCHDAMKCQRVNDCPHRACVNPKHLKALTRKQNLNRRQHPNALKTQCPQGHEFTEENTFRYKNGRRGCRACMRQQGRENARKRRARLPRTQEVTS